MTCALTLFKQKLILAYKQKNMIEFFSKVFLPFIFVAYITADTDLFSMTPNHSQII